MADEVFGILGDALSLEEVEASGIGCTRCTYGEELNSTLRPLVHVYTDKDGYEHYYCGECISALCVQWWAERLSRRVISS